MADLQSILAMLAQLQAQGGQLQQRRPMPQGPEVQVARNQPSIPGIAGDIPLPPPVVAGQIGSRSGEVPLAPQALPLPQVSQQGGQGFNIGEFLGILGDTARGTGRDLLNLPSIVKEGFGTIFGAGDAAPVIPPDPNVVNQVFNGPAGSISPAPQQNVITEPFTPQGGTVGPQQVDTLSAQASPTTQAFADQPISPFVPQPGEQGEARNMFGQFSDFIRSPAGRQLVGRFGAALSPDTAGGRLGALAAQDVQGQAVADLIQQLAGIQGTAAVRQDVPSPFEGVGLSPAEVTQAFESAQGVTRGRLAREAAPLERQTGEERLRILKETSPKARREQEERRATAKAGQVKPPSAREEKAAKEEAFQDMIPGLVEQFPVLKAGFKLDLLSGRTTPDDVINLLMSQGSIEEAVEFRSALEVKTAENLSGVSAREAVQRGAPGKKAQVKIAGLPKFTAEEMKARNLEKHPTFKTADGKALWWNPDNPNAGFALLKE